MRRIERFRKSLFILMVALALLSLGSLGYSYTAKLPFQAQASKEILVGLVEVSSTSDVYITTNWWSRSRASYRVAGALTEEVAQHKGEVIRVEGLITKTSPWSGTIEVEKILEVVGPPQKR